MTDYQPVDFDALHPQPLLIVISGPSGVGKDAVIKALKDRNQPFHFVVTTTSRAPRAGEVAGVDYNFVTRAAFEQLVAENEMLEHALVYQDYKGVPKAQVRQAMASGKDVILRLDVQGAAKIRRLCPEAVLIFLIPSNEQEWFKRLSDRGTETLESLTLRVNTARKEMDQLGMFDYVVVNAQDQLEACVDTIVSIIESEHHRVNPRRITL